MLKRNGKLKQQQQQIKSSSKWPVWHDRNAWKRAIDIHTHTKQSGTSISHCICKCIWRTMLDQHTTRSTHTNIHEASTSTKRRVITISSMSLFPHNVNYTVSLSTRTKQKKLKNNKNTYSSIPVIACVRTSNTDTHRHTRNTSESCMIKSKLK